MPFSEQLKTTVKKKANFTCCWCLDRTKKVHVHHMIPQSQGGPDTEENAAPLCGSCHDLYGNNSDLMKEVRLRRDTWYKTCEEGSPVQVVMVTAHAPSPRQVAALTKGMDEAWSTAAEFEAHLCCSLGEPEVYEERLQQQVHELYVQVAFLLETSQLIGLLADFKVDFEAFRQTKRVRFSADAYGNLYSSTLGQLARYVSPLTTAAPNELERPTATDAVTAAGARG